MSSLESIGYIIIIVGVSLLAYTGLQSTGITPSINITQVEISIKESGIDKLFWISLGLVVAGLLLSFIGTFNLSNLKFNWKIKNGREED